jgi:hypothetical protein
MQTVRSHPYISASVVALIATLLAIAVLLLFHNPALLDVAVPLDFTMISGVSDIQLVSGNALNPEIFFSRAKELFIAALSIAIVEYVHESSSIGSNMNATIRSVQPQLSKEALAFAFLVTDIAALLALVGFAHLAEKIPESSKKYFYPACFVFAFLFSFAHFLVITV